MKRLCRALLMTLAPALLLPGCAFYGKRLEVGTVSKVVPGRTTRAEVERLLGPPKAVTETHGLLLTRHFFHGIEPSRDASIYVRRWHPGNLLLRTLTVNYGTDNIVERKLHDESVTPVYRTNAWYFAGPPLSADSLAFIARGATTEPKLIRSLGEPASRTFDVNGRAWLVWFSLKGRVTNWSDLPVQRLLVRLDQGIVQDHILDVYVLSSFRTDKAPEMN
jgi:hypothetical protein